MVNVTNSVLNRFLCVMSTCMLAIACSSDDNGGKSSPSPPPPTPHCTAIGSTCDMASDPCCYSNGAQTQCKSGTCQVCADTNASCSADSDCCVGHTCSSGTCLLNVGAGGCTKNSDCCCNPSVVNCVNGSCCAVSGTEFGCGNVVVLSYCCSGTARSDQRSDGTCYGYCN